MGPCLSLSHSRDHLAQSFDSYDHFVQGKVTLTPRERTSVEAPPEKAPVGSGEN